MRKYSIILLMIISLFAFTGCNGKSKEDRSEMPSSEVTEITEEIEQTEEITEETTEVIVEVTTEAYNPKTDILIAIDPGHQAPSVDMSASEPNAPGSDVMKRKATGGTTGKYTGVPEYELNLTISKMLKDKLTAQGYQVLMTREDNETAISNAERAQLANDAGADISIRIHANGSEDTSVNGALVLIGSESNPYVGSLYDESYDLGTSVLDAYCQETGMKNLGIQINDTMTGINWSQIPVIILEMGFMSNEQDDYNMQNAEYQTSMVSGIVNGINAYFGMDGEVPSETDADKDETAGSMELQELQQQMQSLADTRIANGDSISVYVENLSTGEYAEIDSRQLQSASLIKLYVAGCIYEERQNTGEFDSEEIESLIKKMITISDNDATNTLVSKLGYGDANAGMERVNTFCQNHGLTDSYMGRLMLDFDSTSDNYTSVRDSAAFLRSVYYGRLAGSDKMLEYLKQQDRTAKLPAGVPEGVVTANKTGELTDVENDVAIVFAGENPYVISVMTEDLSDAAATRAWIVELSEMVYGYFE